MIDHLVVQQAIFVLTLMLSVLLRPYKHWLHNHLDAFVFILLVLLNTLSIYRYFHIVINDETHILVVAFEYVGIFIPAAIMAFYFFFKLGFNYYLKSAKIWFRMNTFHMNLMSKWSHWQTLLGPTMKTLGIGRQEHWLMPHESHQHYRSHLRCRGYWRCHTSLNVFTCTLRLIAKTAKPGGGKILWGGAVLSQKFHMVCYTIINYSMQLYLPRVVQRTHLPLNASTVLFNRTCTCFLQRSLQTAVFQLTRVPTCSSTVISTSFFPSSSRTRPSRYM